MTTPPEANFTPYNVALEDLDSVLALSHEEPNHKKAVYVGFSAIKVVDRNLEKKTQRVYTLTLEEHPLFSWVSSQTLEAGEYTKDALLSFFTLLELYEVTDPSLVSVIQNAKVWEPDLRCKFFTPVYQLPELREQIKKVEFRVKSGLDSEKNTVYLLWANFNDLLLAREEVRDWLLNHFSENLHSETPQGSTRVIAGQPEL